MEEKRVPEEQRPQCPVYRKCGGCQLQNMSYERQLIWKQDRCQKLLGKFGKVAPILGMEDPTHYRNKVQAAFAFDKRHNKIISGVYQASTHRVVAVDSCLTEDQKADEVIGTIRGLLKDFKLTAYDEDTGRGFLRHVLVKRGFGTGELMVVLVTGTPIFPAKNHFVAALRKKHPEITTIVMNCNPKQTSMVLGTQERVLYGKGFIKDSLCGLRFAISPRSFYQVNPVQTEALYQRAIQMAQLTGRERVLDAYCGIGTISLIAAGQAKEVIGVELNRDAVQDAIANAKRNGVRNATFICEDAGRFMTRMAQEREGVDVVFLDPPRSGSDEAFLRSLCALGPKRVVYISCNPQTQKRDLAVLAAGGYRVEAIQPVDMFPQTGHCDCIASLSK